MHSKPNNKDHSRAERTSPNKADAPQGVFAPRKRPRSTLLAIVFTVIKLVVVAGILCGFIGLGLVLGIAKAYIDTTPTLDISALTESDRTSYIYDGNGNTGRCKVMDGSGNVTDDYRYEYDSLGRLIRSSQVSDGETVLRTEHIYDADNRLTNQSYQLGASSFSESYEYNKNDGSMKSMDTANGDTLSFTYDAIKRLESVAAGSRYTKTYGYRTISGSQTTTQISSLAYSGFTGAPTYRYAYTANGNIKSVQNPN